MKTSFIPAGILLVLLLGAPTQGGAQDGPALYKKKCLSCHGAAGKGDGPMGRATKTPDLTNGEEMTKKTDAQLAEIITQGSKKMRAFRDLKAEEVEALVSYVRTFSAEK